MLRVALTGGIGTGKSYVLARLAARGVPTIDSDAVVHRLLAGGTPVAAAIAERFGRAVIGEAGAVDRRALGRLVFRDPSARLALEDIVHPAVYAEIDAWMSASSSAGARWSVADIPLLFESGHEADFDLVVVAACDPSLQIRRVVARDGLAEEEARARLRAQWPIEEKAKRADYVIDTSRSFEDTDRQVDRMAEQIEVRAQTRERRT